MAKNEIRSGTASVTKRVQITGGPSKFELMLSLFHGDDQFHERQEVIFKLKKPIGEAKSLYVTINEVKCEDSGAEALLFKGMMTERTRQTLGDAFQREVAGNFSTSRRNGWLILTIMGSD